MHSFQQYLRAGCLTIWLTLSGVVAGPFSQDAYSDDLYSITQINAPDAPNGTYLLGNNNEGDIVGYYLDSHGTHGLLAFPPF